MANHSSDPDAAVGGPDEQARHAEPPDRGQHHGDARAGQPPDWSGGPASTTAHMPAPQGWQGRVGGMPEHGGPVGAVPWAGGWPAPPPAEAHRPADGWAGGQTAPGGWGRPDDGRGQPGPADPAPWYGGGT